MTDLMSQKIEKLKDLIKNSVTKLHNGQTQNDIYLQVVHLDTSKQFKSTKARLSDGTLDVDTVLVFEAHTKVTNKKLKNYSIIRLGSKSLFRAAKAVGICSSCIHHI